MHRILVLRGGALGDFLVTLPALALLRRRWPQAHIELVGNATAAALARARGLLTAVHSQHEGRWAALYGTGPLPADLAQWLATFDLVLNYWPDPHGELRRRFPARPGQLFLCAAAMPERAPAAAHYCAALAELGLTTSDHFYPLARIFHGHEDSLQRNIRPPFGRSDVVAASPDKVGPTGRRFHTSGCEIFGLARTDPTCADPGAPILVHPGSGSPRKNWPRERWLQLLPDLPGPVTLVLGEAEAPHWRDRDLPSVGRLLEPALEELVGQFARCRLFLGHDSGVSHLAAACGAPSLLLFGPTDPALWAPPAAHVRVIRRGPALDLISVEDVRRELATMPLRRA